MSLKLACLYTSVLIGVELMAISLSWKGWTFPTTWKHFQSKTRAFH